MRTRRFRGWRRRAVVAAAVTAVLTVHPLPAGAEGQHLYVMSGTGGGLAVVFNRAGLIALAPLVNVAFPRVQTRIDATPTSSARGTPADPGVAAGASAIGPVLGLPPGLAPGYPLFADAAYPTGAPSAETGDAQDVGEQQGAWRFGYGRAEATAEQATAEAHFGRVEATPAEPDGSSVAVSLPASPAGRVWLRSLTEKVAGAMRAGGHRPVMPGGQDSSVLVRIGGGSASSDSVREGARVAGFAESRAFGIVLLGGLVRIDSVFSRTSVSIPQPGTPPVVELGSTVSGVSVLGMEGRFGAGGLELPGASLPVQEAVVGAINQAFAEQGGTFSVGKVQSTGDAAGVAALAFDFDGSLTPVVPRVLGPESDTAQVGIGATALRFSSVREDDGSETGASGSTGADSSAVPDAGPSAADAPLVAGGGVSAPDDPGVRTGDEASPAGADAPGASVAEDGLSGPEASLSDLLSATGGSGPAEGRSGAAVPLVAAPPGTAAASQPVALAAHAGTGRAALINDTSTRLTTLMTVMAWGAVLWVGMLLRVRMVRR